MVSNPCETIQEVIDFGVVSEFMVERPLLGFLSTHRQCGHVLCAAVDSWCYLVGVF